MVELLTVITIIVILVGITTSVFIYGIHTAKDSQCASNLKSISIGLDLYASDHDDYFPPYRSFSPPIDGHDPRELLALAIMNYKVSEAQLYCPLDPLSGKQGYIGRQQLDHRYSSYSEAPAFIVFGRRSGFLVLTARSNILEPSRTQEFF